MRNTTPPRIITLAEAASLAESRPEEWGQFQLDSDRAQAVVHPADAFEAAAEDAYDQARYLAAIRERTERGDA